MRPGKRMKQSVEGHDTQQKGIPKRKLTDISFILGIQEPCSNQEPNGDFAISEQTEEDGQIALVPSKVHNHINWRACTLVRIL